MVYSSSSTLITNYFQGQTNLLSVFSNLSSRHAMPAQAVFVATALLACCTRYVRGRYMARSLIFSTYQIPHSSKIVKTSVYNIQLAQQLSIWSDQRPLVLVKNSFPNFFSLQAVCMQSIRFTCQESPFLRVSRYVPPTKPNTAPFLIKPQF